MSFAMEMKDFFSGFKQTSDAVGKYQDRQQKKKDTFDVDKARGDFKGAIPLDKDAAKTAAKGSPAASDITAPDATASAAPDTSDPSSDASNSSDEYVVGSNDDNRGPKNILRPQEPMQRKNPQGAIPTDYYYQVPTDMAQEPNQGMYMYAAGGGSIGGGGGDGPDNSGQNGNAHSDNIAASAIPGAGPAAGAPVAPVAPVAPAAPPGGKSAIQPATSPQGQAPATLGEALHHGLTFLGNALGLSRRGQGVGEDHAAAAGQQKLLEGYVTPNEPPPTPQEVAQIHQTVDPQNQMSDSVRNVYALEKGYEFYRDRGDMAKASKFAASLIQSAGDTARQYGMQAVNSGKQGDVDGMIASSVKAYNSIPDGMNVTAEKGQNGTINITRTNSAGETVDQHQLTPQQVLQMATGISSKSGFYEAVMQAANPETAKNKLDKEKLAFDEKYKGASLDERQKHDAAMEALGGKRVGVEQGSLDERTSKDKTTADDKEAKKTLQMPKGDKAFTSAVSGADDVTTKILGGDQGDPDVESKKPEYVPLRDLIGTVTYFGNGMSKEQAGAFVDGLTKGDSGYTMDKDAHGNLVVSHDGDSVQLPAAAAGRIKSLQRKRGVVPAPEAAAGKGDPGGAPAPVVSTPAAPAATAGAGAPPAAQRVVGKIYPSPKGPVKWTGTGWVIAG